MSKTLKKVLITAAVILAVIGAVWGGLVIFRDAQKKPVNVYSVSDFSQTEYWGERSESSGMVTTDKLQNVTISDTQKVNEVFVEEGQTVKVGDPLLAYDTTLSDIDLEKARINLEKLNLQSETAKTELQKLQNMRPHSSVLVTPPSSDIQYTPQSTPMLLQGSGTADDPFYYLWGENDPFTTSMLSQLFPKEQPSEPTEPTEPTEPAEPTEPSEPAEPGTGEGESPDEGETPAPVNPNESYVVFLVRENNALNAPIVNYWGLYLDRSSGEIVFRVFRPALPESIENFEVAPEPYYEESGSEYTAAELAKMRKEKEQELKELDVSIKLAEVQLQKLEEEVNDGVVRSKIDGVVKAVRDPDAAYQESKPVVEVSGGGGYYIDVAMSELEFGNIEVGQTVTVNSWQSGNTYEGTVTEISEYPTSNANSWSDGNSNVSYYPFRVFVNEDAELQEYEYVSVSYQGAAQASSGLYLENEFLRTDNGRSYVFVRGEDGLLEQRTVQTGRSLWGSYTEIRGGLTLDDFVAFPYGKDVKDGAKTQEATPDQLYNGL